MKKIHGFQIVTSLKDLKYGRFSNFIEKLIENNKNNDDLYSLDEVREVADLMLDIDLADKLIEELNTKMNEK